MNGASEYIARLVASGELNAEHIEELVRFYQAEHGLEVDGKPGPRTRALIEAEFASRGGPSALPLMRCWPLRKLRDGREPRITSRHGVRNPERRNHNGVDLFYRYDPDHDPPMKSGDGGRAGKWWIPDETFAIACATGRVELAGWSPTGFRVWLSLVDGWHLGYFHLSRLFVNAGDVVERGTPIGIVGDNPVDNDARHLHFELYYGDLAKYPVGTRDPEVFLSTADVLDAKA